MTDEQSPPRREPDWEANLYGAPPPAGPEFRVHDGMAGHTLSTVGNAMMIRLRTA